MRIFLPFFPASGEHVNVLQARFLPQPLGDAVARVAAFPAAINDNFSFRLPSREHRRQEIIPVVFVQGERPGTCARANSSLGRASSQRTAAPAFASASSHLMRDRPASLPRRIAAKIKRLPDRREKSETEKEQRPAATPKRARATCRWRGGGSAGSSRSRRSRGRVLRMRIDADVGVKQFSAYPSGNPAGFSASRSSAGSSASASR